MNKKMIKTIALSAVILGSTGLYSCNRNKDTTAPEFSEVSRPRTKGGEGVIELRGEYLERRSETSTHSHVRGTVTDNEALKQLRIDVHNANDGHSHKSSNDFKHLALDKIIAISGTSYSFDIDIDHAIEDKIISGVYDIAIHATDEAGNATSFANGRSVLRQIYLTRPYQPLVIHENDEGSSLIDEISLTHGEKLTLPIEIEDKRGDWNLSLKFLRVEIEKEHDHKSGESKPFDIFWGTSSYFENNQGVLLSNYNLPNSNEQNKINLADLLEALANNYTADSKHDHYILRITAEDEKRNLTIREFELKISSAI